MLTFLLAEQNLWFGIALSIVIFISLLEGVGTLIGLSISSMLDNLFSIDAEFDTELPDSALSSLLGWLCLNRLPLLIWLMLLLTNFGVSGYSINFVLSSSFLPTWLSILLAAVIAILLTRYTASYLSRLMPKNESTAVSAEGFSGLVATITLGSASRGNAAEAVLKDEFEQKHYVLVEPEVEGQVFPQGTRVILKHKQDSIWSVIKL